MSQYTIILTSESGYDIAKTIANEFSDIQIISKCDIEGVTKVDSLSRWTIDNFEHAQTLIFIGAIGIAVRCIAPCVADKHQDPAVINIDTTGKFVVSLLSGHIGGANELTKQLAHTIGAQPVITTRSDNTDLWALDTIGNKFGWKTEYKDGSINVPISKFVNLRKTALLLDVRDSGCDELERTKPTHVDLFYDATKIPQAEYELIIAVTPFIYTEFIIDTLYFRPQALSVGVGCRQNCNPESVNSYIADKLIKENISPLSIGKLATIDIKKYEPLIAELAAEFKVNSVEIYRADELEQVVVPNPSSKVEQVTGSSSVSEASALLSSGNSELLVAKQKAKLSDGNDFTFAVAMERSMVRGGHIEIVGAGPGDPDLISVRGRKFLEASDLILYAGSLVPIELTYCAKDGATVRSSASMNLEEQFQIMKEFYDKGKLVVRLHTGDPCIYGAIQEQMAYFDEYNMSYHITPGISSFLAAAAALRSQFTIPEKVQTIILTRGEGRTAMPEKEKLHLLARSQSTMCIFLSASIVDDVQRDLLEHYPPETPVAACYKLTWKDERIYRGELKDLTKIIKDNNLTLTTMIVVGESIDNRHGLSRLYADEFKHMFRS